MIVLPAARRGALMERGLVLGGRRGRCVRVAAARHGEEPAHVRVR
ncbi:MULTISPECIES: hypothetical protein [Protofrankia]|nr:MULTISPECIES: hypothetical protein [Protofrankia]